MHCQSFHNNDTSSSSRLDSAQQFGEAQFGDSTHHSALSRPGHRPRRTAMQRREQQKRADARSICRLMQGLDSIQMHRGSTLSRLGAVVHQHLSGSADTHGSFRDSMPLCRHYLAGRCTFGSKCRFAHGDPYGGNEQQCNWNSQQQDSDHIKTLSEPIDMFGEVGRRDAPGTTNGGTIGTRAQGHDIYSSNDDNMQQHDRTSNGTQQARAQEPSPIPSNDMRHEQEPDEDQWRDDLLEKQLHDSNSIDVSVSVASSNPTTASIKSQQEHGESIWKPGAETMQPESRDGAEAATPHNHEQLVSDCDHAAESQAERGIAATVSAPQAEHGIGVAVSSNMASAIERSVSQSQAPCKYSDRSRRAKNVRRVAAGRFGAAPLGKRLRFKQDWNPCSARQIAQEIAAAASFNANKIVKLSSKSSPQDWRPNAAQVTTQDLRRIIGEFIRNKNFSSVTLREVREMLEQEFGLDEGAMTTRKDDIKQAVLDIVNSRKS